MDHRRPVLGGPVRFFGAPRLPWTGLGLGLGHYGSKDRTGPDFQALNIPASRASVGGG